MRALRAGMLGGLVAAAAGASGCRTRVPVAYQVEPTPAVVGCPPSGCAPAADQIEITYLGVSGFLVRYRDRALLTAPFFTNPPLRDVAPTSRLRLFPRRGGVIRPDAVLIERLLPAAANDASMVLVGHSHYDHLMDVPYIARMRSRRATIYGGPTTRHILMGDSLLRKMPERLFAIAGPDVATADREGKWLYDADSTFRVMAIESDHAPTLGLFGRGTLFAPGRVDHDLKSLPSYADEWKAGETLSFLIDVLERGQPRPKLRIYFQSSASRPTRGLPPRSVLDQRAVDIALLCAPSSSSLRGVPDKLLEFLRPSYVLVGHWESFFRPQTLPIILGAATDADKFLRALTRSLPPASGWQMPLPRTTVRFNPR